MVAGSIQATNATSLPICRITATSLGSPDRSYDNLRSNAVLVGPGATAEVFVPDTRDPAQDMNAQTADTKFDLTAYGCKYEAMQQRPSDLVVMRRSIDVSQDKSIIIH
jgi:hypothetical protein